VRPPGRSFRSRSLGSKLIQSYLVILALGGITTSLIGSSIVSAAIMGLARRAVDDNLVTVRTIYDHELQSVRRTVSYASADRRLAAMQERDDTAGIRPFLESVARDAGLDFLTATNRVGHVLARWPSTHRGDDASDLPAVREALTGNAVAATEIIAADRLALEDPGLRDRAALALVPTPRARPADRVESSDGMVLLAASPIRSPVGDPVGALYGGVLLNRNFAIVDRVWDLQYEGETYRGRDIGTVTIFQGDVRIATTVRRRTGERALGTRASAEVSEAVLDRGTAWEDRAFVVDDWYITAYVPVQDLEGSIVGMLYVGLLERAYTSIRDRVILLFFLIAGTGFVLIIGVTHWTTRSLTRPIDDLVAATRQVSAGELGQQLPSNYQGELAQLAWSFNRMTASLRRMRSDLEESARTLEQRVAERTEELVGMQSKVTQAERLASVGMLAAGVAHEVNNPLGAILSLTALTLEDMPADHPDRENLEVVVEQALKCRDIVRGLLEFSRQSDLQIERVNVNAVLENTIGLIGKQALFYNIEIIRDLDPQLPAIHAGRAPVQQVFLNILMNAAQAIETSGTITLSTRRRSDEGGEEEIEIEIADTGRGIPPEDIGRIFDPFFTTKKAGLGTGLGLSIAYGIVTRHGGTIVVDSEPGRGASFRIRLPVEALVTPSEEVDATSGAS